MSRTFRWVLAATLFTTVTGAPLIAQEQAPPTGPPQQPQLPDSVQELISEFRQTQQTLDSIQTQVMEATPTLQEHRSELQETIQATMIEMNPGLEPKMDRMETIQTEVLEAQQNQNQQRVQELVTEGRGIRQEIQSAQAEAMQQDEVAQAIQEFRDELVAAMTEVDPGVEEMLDRLEELSQRLQAIQMGGGD